MAAQILSLRDWVKEELDQVNDSDAVLSDDFIDQLIIKHRIVDPRRALHFFNQDDCGTTWLQQASQLGGRARITLTDLGAGSAAALATFGHTYLYYFHPDLLEVTVDDVLFDPDSEYDFNPFALTVTFDPPLTGSPVVKITGHLVNMTYRGAMWAAFRSLAGRVATLADVQGSENFRQLAASIRAAGDRDWGNRIIRRGR